MRSCTAPLSSSSPPSCVAAGGAAASSGGRPSLTGSAPCPAFAGYTCSTLAVPLDHAGRRRGTLRLAVAASDNVRAPRGVLLLITGGPGQPGVPCAGAHPGDPRRRAARLPGRRLRPAGHRRRGARLSRVAVRDGQLRPLAAVGGRRPRVLAPAGRTASVLRDGRRRRRHGVASPRARRRTLDARRHLVRLVRRRAVRARPSRSRAAARARLRRPARRPDRPRCRSSSGRRPACSDRSAARPASPISPRSCVRATTARSCSTR